MSDAVTVVILAVDDDALLLDTAASALEEGGYSVLQCHSADKALRLLKERGAELGGIVTDVNLGRGETGWDVARFARELNPNIPIVYVTGDSAHEWASQGVPHSVLLQKPFAPADLVVALAGLRKLD